MIVAFCMCFDRSWNVFTFWVRRRFFGANSCDKRHTLDFRLPWVFWLQSLKLNFLDVVLFNVFFWQQQVFEFFAFKVPSFSLFSCLETDAKQERKECVVEKMEIIICLVWNEIDFLINCPKFDDQILQSQLLLILRSRFDFSHRSIFRSLLEFCRVVIAWLLDDGQT